MSIIESTYLLLEDTDAASALDRVVALLTEMGEKARLRTVAESGWIQLQSTGIRNTLPPVRVRRALMKLEPTEGLTEAQTFARDLSALLECEAISLECVTSVDYVAFARFRSGRESRRFVYCPEGEGWEIDVGEREAWERYEDDAGYDGAGPTAHYVGGALSLPGFFMQETTVREEDI